MKNYVIIGGGIASVACIEGIRQTDESGKIYLVSGEGKPTYCRPLISYYLQGLTDFNKMKYRPDSFYTDMNCELIFGKAEKIDAEKKTVKIGDRTVKYDGLCVATGSSPFVPPFSGLNTVENKTAFMTEDDALYIEKNLSPDSKVLIIGAGLIGLKCAEGLVGRVKSITVSDLATRVLSSILDDECAIYMQRALEEQGVSFMLGDSVSAFDKTTATFNSGKKVDFDLLILAVGVRANTSLVKDAGGEVNRGIIVNGKMQTSVKDVYAAGDCAEGFDNSVNANRVLAILPSAYQQGFTAGVNMAGGDKTLNDEFPLNAIGFFGLHALTAGAYTGEAYQEKTEKGIKRLFFDGDRLVGFILIGDVKGAGIYTSLIKNKSVLTEKMKKMLEKSPSLAIFDSKTRSQKLGGVV
ncbi:MAG: NAD(P)/FAD-dependent oxidoreductase [Clostridia bacterium]|nr:NAD(P)/FAD-dependent oxidoreductase [Clostridia bacterium]